MTKQINAWKIVILTTRGAEFETYGDSPSVGSTHAEAVLVMSYLSETMFWLQEWTGSYTKYRENIFFWDFCVKQ